jgi:hypothetical protein
MQKFSLYIKSNKFYWSANKIIYSGIFICCGILFFKQKVLNIESNIFDKIFAGIIVCFFMSGLVTKLKGFSQIEPIDGKLEGYLIFEKEAIIVGDEIYPIEKIRTIKISNDDYSGAFKNISKGNLGPALSNGTNNFIVIYLVSGESKRYQFELINSDDFQKVRETLIDYNIIGKIDYWELAQVLGERSTSETLALTDEIEKRRTTTHSGLA